MAGTKASVDSLRIGVKNSGGGGVGVKLRLVVRQEDGEEGLERCWWGILAGDWRL